MVEKETVKGQNGSLAKRILGFYITGFKEMTWGRTMWAVIAIKLFIMFAILRAFLFPNFLKDKGTNHEERADYITSEYERRALGDEAQR